MSPFDGVRGLAASDVLGALWRKMWIVALVAAVCSVTALLYSNSQTPMYEATARLLYQEPTDVSDPTSDRGSVNTDSMAIQLQSVSSTIESPDVRSRVESLARREDTQLEYEVTATPVAPDNDSSVATFPNSIDITAVTTSPESAARLANAYAEAVIDLRSDGARARYQAAQEVIKSQLELYTTPASRLTPDYAILTQQLRSLQIAEGTATGDFSVVVPARPPDAPVSPKPVRDAALGLALGIVVGVAVAFLSARLDTRVRSYREVAEIVGLPVIGRIPHIPGHTAGDTDLVTIVDPHGHVSEALRMLRSSLEWVGIDGDFKSLMVTSCLKGEGKTLVVSNLAITLARSGHRVILVEGDLRAPRLHRVFEIPNGIGLTSVVLGKTDLADALQPYPLAAASSPVMAGTRVRLRGQDKRAAEVLGEGSLTILPSGPLPPDPGGLVASRRMTGLLQQLDDLDADYILVDAPPLLVVGDAGALAPRVDGVMLVSSIDMTRRPLLQSGRDVLEALPCRKVGVVVVGERAERRGYYEYRSEVAEVAGQASRA